jgi:arginase family enzyme
MRNPAVGGEHTDARPILRANCRKHGPLGVVHIDVRADVAKHMSGTAIAHGPACTQGDRHDCPTPFDAHQQS